MNRGTLLAALVLSSFVAGCGEGVDSPLCTPGASVACVGTSGCAGSQVCDQEGAAFGVCACGPGLDAGPEDADTNDAALDGGYADGGPEDGGADAGPSDGGVDAAAGPCDLAAQTGCGAGERCVWIADVLGGGSAQCRTDGTAAPLEACLAPEAGGVDECVAGHACVTGTCERVCSTDEDECGPDFVCSRFFGFVDDGVTGVCVPRCDPVTQERLHDDAPACGSPNPLTPSQGCYGPMIGPFTCARVAQGAATRTHGMAPIGTASGPFLSGCAPGHLPFGTDIAGVFVCRALCTPVVTMMGNDEQRQGAAPYTCPARGAAAATAECRFGGLFTQNPSAAAPGVGVCVDPAMLSYDHDLDMQTAPIPWPSCSTLTSGDLDGNGIPDDQSWGCTPTPAP